jgi:hypothetical protein
MCWKGRLLPQWRVYLAEFHCAGFITLQATENEQDQQGLVGCAFVALLPDADTVKGLENLSSGHGRDGGFVGTAHLGSSRLLPSTMLNATASLGVPPVIGIPL